jgi:hypothetical protein
MNAPTITTTTDGHKAPVRHYKYSGLVAPTDALHQVIQAPAPGAAFDEHYLPPNSVPVTIHNPPPTRVIYVPQFSPTVFGGSSGYNPAADCAGSFMSYKFQPNNNCYAYACNIASNSFAQPGRFSGNQITAATLNGPDIQAFAVQDGLQAAGTTLDDLKAFAAKRMDQKGTGTLDGHFVALMISPAGDNNWGGDYHWARCDDNINFSSWSQKDGGDQVTNFDFAGNPITNPATANWTVNQGPVQPNPNQPDYNPDDMICEYNFYCFMFVPDAGVNIL